MYFTYIVSCVDNYLYTGITWNLQKRVHEHNNGEVPYTKNRRPVKLVFYEALGSRQEAAKREKEIKGWRRQKKEFLIKEFNQSQSN